MNFKIPSCGELLRSFIIGIIIPSPCKYCLVRACCDKRQCDAHDKYIVACCDKRQCDAHDKYIVDWIRLNIRLKRWSSPLWWIYSIANFIRNC